MPPHHGDAGTDGKQRPGLSVIAGRRLVLDGVVAAGTVAGTELIPPEPVGGSDPWRRWRTPVSLTSMDPSRSQPACARSGEPADAQHWRHGEPTVAAAPLSPPVPAITKRPFTTCT